MCPEWMNAILAGFATVVIVGSACVIQCRELISKNVSGAGPDALLNFTALGFKHGHRIDEYDVVTEDGYILKLFHIPGDRQRPVLLMHGIMDSADTYIIRGRSSLALALAARDYDVWAGNCRGNKYSRRHVTLNPDHDKMFWNFTFHESGYYDLPTLIDFVLKKTGQASLSAIGHSQGNTVFYALGSTRPEYNSKINVMIAISPVCFLLSPKPPLRTLIALGPTLYNIISGLGLQELFGDKTALRMSLKAICEQKYIGYKICAHGIFFLLFGSNPAELEPEFLRTVWAHYPAGTSRRNALHWLQIANNRNFTQYDYGLSGNWELYRSEKPPSYDLRSVKMRVAMLFGENDGVCSLEDVRLLRDSLPNVAEYRLNEHKKFNHLDGVWGRNMEIYLFPSIFEILQKYIAPIL